jgi:hypothetical protein
METNEMDPNEILKKMMRKRIKMKEILISL